MTWLLIGVGGALGAILRRAFSVWFQTPFFPWATLLVNVLGAFLIGWIVFFFQKRGPQPYLDAFWRTGFCGGFTTFSTFSLETWALIDRGDGGLAILYVVSSLAGAFCAVWTAKWLAA